MWAGLRGTTARVGLLTFLNGLLHFSLFHELPVHILPHFFFKDGTVVVFLLLEL